MNANDLNNCANCPVHNVGNLKKLGINMSDYNYVVALAGNPNTGKSTVFNNLTPRSRRSAGFPGSLRRVASAPRPSGSGRTRRAPGGDRRGFLAAPIRRTGSRPPCRAPSTPGSGTRRTARSRDPAAAPASG